MKALVVTSFLGALAACAGLPRGDDAIAHDPASEAGRVDIGDPYVVALFAHPPGSSSGKICTGTVIGARTVLTAAHCVDPRVIGADRVIEVLTGPTPALPGVVASATAVDPAWDPGDLYAGHDIGIVHTGEDLGLPAVAIGPVDLGAQVRLVGYGGDGDALAGGTRRVAVADVVATSRRLLRDRTAHRQTCQGDSGGPALQLVNGERAVVGVTSFGRDPAPSSPCFAGGFHSRVDAHAAFITAHTF